MRKKLLLCTLGLILAAPAARGAGEFWLHVRVEESGKEGDHVRINMPVSMVEKLLPLIETDEFEGGKLRFEANEIDGADLRAMWNAVRESADGEFVTVESRDQNVRVAKSGGELLVKVEETGKQGEKGEKVDIQIPLAVVDSLLSGEDDELNLLAGLAALRESGTGVRVTVNDEHDAVRIWVDQKSQSGE
jgi:hypothetical protein